MKIKLCGVRGSLPTPILENEYKNKVLSILDQAKEQWKINLETPSSEIFESLPIYLKKNLGGNTTSIFIESEKGTKLVCDLGTGVRVLGNELAGLAFTKGFTLHCLVTHTHWDHIQGWPFFKPAYSPQVTIHFYSCITNLQERMERQQHVENFPIRLQDMASQKHFHLWIENQTYTIEDLKITPFPLKHPGSCTGFKIEENGKHFLFCTDVEYSEEQKDFLKELYPIAKNSEAIIIDAQYSEEEAQKKKGWGHTSMKFALEFAEILESKNVYLTHHEPDHTDESIHKTMLQETNGFHSDKLKIHIAYEGLEFHI